MDYRFPYPAAILTMLIFATALGSSYYAGHISRRPPELGWTPSEQWHRICASPGLTEMLFGSVTLLWGTFLLFLQGASDPVSAIMRQFAPMIYWSALMMIVGGLQPIFVLCRNAAGRICCCVAELWVFGFIALAIVWSHAVVPGLLILPAYAIWSGFLANLVRRETGGIYGRADEGHIIAGIALVGPLVTAYMAYRSKKGEKKDDQAIAREGHAWDENKDLRTRLTEAEKDRADLQMKLIDEHQARKHAEDDAEVWKRKERETAERAAILARKLRLIDPNDIDTIGL